jgi:hypothetical protein
MAAPVMKSDAGLARKTAMPETKGFVLKVYQELAPIERRPMAAMTRRPATRKVVT